jgi:hypothetical protein
MSRKEEKMRLFKHREREQHSKDYHGHNRRTTALLPRPRKAETASVAIHQFDCQRAEQFLLALEANETTCCLYTTSRFYKSRAAALVFRGRMLGCVYGSKHMEGQLFGQAAFDYMHRELSHRETELDAYALDEALALAAASMFHGTVIDSTGRDDPAASFRAACETLKYYNRPGTIFILDGTAQAIFAAYFFRGKTVGAFSFDDGWLNPQYESAEPYLKAAKKVEVVGGMLAASSVEEVEKLTFSLTGLADRKAEEWGGMSQEEVSNVMLIGFASHGQGRPIKTLTDVNRFVPRTKGTAVQLNRPIVAANPFKINPLSTY